MSEQPTPRASLVSVNAVQCLECAYTYAKPTSGGTVQRNPGCPRCGYIGWMPAALDVIPAGEPSHFVADLLQRRAGRLR